MSAPGPGPGELGALEPLLERFRRGERVGLARVISAVEDQRPGFQALLHEIVSGAPEASRVGITGPPGAGKSTLVSAIATAHREAGHEVGVVAVDPTSPYSGGALLGDRIRMNDLATDAGIFIRSMATRGSLGGLATTTREVIDVMDAFGFPHILVETVGVGQTELEITGAADTVVVVLVPESGDAIQAMKAGLMEIADVFVVNKADRPGADRLLRELRGALHLRTGRQGPLPAHHGVDLSKAGSEAQESTPEPEEPERWEIPVVKTVAQDGEGVDDLLGAIDAHRSYLVASGELERRRRDRAARRVRDVVERDLRRIARARTRDAIERGMEAIASGEATPYSLAAEIVASLVAGER